MTDGTGESSNMPSEVNAVGRTYVIQPIHDKYDHRLETNHGRNAPAQRAWNGYLQRAFTSLRVPLVRAPDGATYKIRLLDVLRDARKI